MNALAQQILETTTPFFEEKESEELLTKTTLQYKELLQKQANINRESAKNQEHFYRSNGMAISMNIAVECLNDPFRTKRFVLGTYQAIQDLLKKGKRNLRVLYAGTGPFASILLPTLLKLQEEDVHFTLMDINEDTIQHLKSLLKKLELNPDKIDVLIADATAYKIDPNAPFDIILSETMQSALAREQQVSVYLNLMRQSPEKTLFIPEKIEVFLCLRKTGLENNKITEENCEEVAQIFEVSKQLLNDTEESGKPPEKISHIPKSALDEKDLMFLSTKIQIFGNQALNNLGTSLTQPLILDNLSHRTEEDLSVATQYKIDQDPRFEFQLR
jgi:hypothetical protein